MPVTGTLRKYLPAAVAAVAVALAGAGCLGGGGTKAGGASARHTTVLTLASEISGGQPEQLDAFARAVERQSGGTLRIQFAPNWRAGDLKQERDMIADVRAGKVELGWVGARAWDWEGVKSFDALLAPFLIDSHALEQRVFEAGIPQRMLPAVGKTGVVPIGVLPGPLRTVLGVGRPLSGPADFRGKTIGAQGIVAAETMRALGARPRQVFAQAKLNGLDGIEEQPSAIIGNRHTSHADFLSANLSLWPRPLVIFAAPRLFRSLSPTQRVVLRKAAAAAVGPAMAASRKEDDQSAAILCHLALRVVEEKPAQLAALRRAVEPVYRQLSGDPTTRRLIAEIERMKRTTPPEAPVPCRSAAQTRRQAASPLDGAWEMSVGRGDLLGNPAYKVLSDSAVHPTPEDLRLDVGDYRLVLHSGHAWFGHRSSAEVAHETGVYTVRGAIVQFRWLNGNDAGETHTYRWSIYRGLLTFRRPPAGYQSGPPNPIFAPWHHVGR